MDKDVGIFISYFLIGTVVGAIRRAQRPRAGCWAILSHAAGSGVAGWIAGLICLHFLDRRVPYLSLLAVTLAGWIGPALVDWTSELALRRVRTKLQNGDHDEPR